MVQPRSHRCFGREYENVEVKIHEILVSALHAGEWSASRSGLLYLQVNQWEYICLGICESVLKKDM
jgi:hypothetical protein